MHDVTRIVALSAALLALPATVVVAGGVRGNKAPASAPASEAPAGVEPNACGCWKDAQGVCLCTRSSRCGCPGECEPRGCDEARARALEKEMEAELEKAREAERKQRAAREQEEAEAAQ